MTPNRSARLGRHRWKGGPQGGRPFTQKAFTAISLFFFSFKRLDWTVASSFIIAVIE